MKVCQIIEKIIKIKFKRDDIQIESVQLVDIRLRPCIGCGKCFKTSKCCNDDSFNILYSKIAESDAVFIVSPHYAPISAKLSMLLEKMEQISFLHWFHDNNYKPAVYQKPVGIIAHGGGSDDITLRSYKHMVLDTIANALQTIMMDVIGLDEKWPTGVVFPVKKVHKDENATFPIQLYDWIDIENRLTLLVEKVIEKADKKI